MSATDRMRDVACRLAGRVWTHCRICRTGHVYQAENVVPGLAVAFLSDHTETVVGDASPVRPRPRVRLLPVEGEAVGVEVCAVGGLDDVGCRAPRRSGVDLRRHARGGGRVGGDVHLLQPWRCGMTEASPLVTVTVVALLVGAVWLAMRLVEWWWTRRWLRRLPPLRVGEATRRRHLERIRREAEAMRR